MNERVIVITGGRGAIGTSLARRLVEREASRVYILDDLSSGSHNPSPGAEFIHCDVANSEKLPKLFKVLAPSSVFHLAAHFANQNSVDHPRSDATTNILGTINLFESVRGLSNPSKVVYASSSCVYGHGENMVEDSPVYPHETPYAINKYAGELYSYYYAHVKKVPSVSIRLFNTYGPGEAPGRYRNVIPNFIDQALSNNPITITGDGTETRDFTYVDDTVDLLIRAALSEYKEGEVFNGGTGRKTSIGELAKLIIRLTASESEIVHKPRRDWDAVPDRCAQNAKAKSLLGYNPNVPLDLGLQYTIDWIRQWRASSTVQPG